MKMITMIVVLLVGNLAFAAKGTSKKTSSFGKEPASQVNCASRVNTSLLSNTNLKKRTVRTADKGQGRDKTKH